MQANFISGICYSGRQKLKFIGIPTKNAFLVKEFLTKIEKQASGPKQLSTCL